MTDKKLHGIITINKPVGPTSHDIIGQVRRITGEKRVGHAGTLDPLASGVLVVGIGREHTRQLAKIVQHEKEYLATICFGQTSTTDDEEGEKRSVEGVKQPTSQEIKLALKYFIGTIKQTPPLYSAIKIKGQRAYGLAREGKEPALESRPVFIKKIETLRYQYPLLEIKITCGAGVYIRALARDLGNKLGTGGYLANLVRTRVGQFTLKKAITLSPFDNTPAPPKL